MKRASLRDSLALAWLLSSETAPVPLGKSGKAIPFGAALLSPAALLLVLLCLPFIHHADRKSMVCIDGPRRGPLRSRLVAAAGLIVLGVVGLDHFAPVVLHVLIALSVPLILISCFAWMLSSPDTARQRAPGANWKLSMLAAKRGQYAIIDTAKCADTLIRPGETASAVARTAQHAEVYRRFGFVPTAPDALTLIYTKP